MSSLGQAFCTLRMVARSSYCLNTKYFQKTNIAEEEKAPKVEKRTKKQKMSDKASFSKPTDNIRKHSRRQQSKNKRNSTRNLLLS